LIELENYNGWNLPYAKTVNINCTDPGLSPFVLDNDYIVEMNINAYFGIVVTGQDFPDDPSITLEKSQVEYAFDGINGHIIEGYFSPASMIISGFLNGATEASNVTVDFTIFFAFGVQGEYGL
jgi:hypothetical protein